MVLVFRSLRMISLRSFCATRQTLGGALQGYVSVPALGYITPPCVHFFSLHIDNVSGHSYKFLKIFTYESVICFYAQYSNLLAQFKIKCSNTGKRKWASLRRAGRPCVQRSNSSMQLFRVLVGAKRRVLIYGVKLGMDKGLSTLLVVVRCGEPLVHGMHNGINQDNPRKRERYNKSCISSGKKMKGG